MLKLLRRCRFVLPISGVLVCLLLVFFFQNSLKNHNTTDNNSQYSDPDSGLINELADQKNIKELEYASESILETLSDKYIREDGMVESEFNKTTSESLSYSMLITVSSNNRDVFDRNFNWIRKNLQVRSGDRLFSWLWRNGKVRDINPATDADQDIAYALYLAYKQWGDESYLRSSIEIVRDIWNLETKQIKGVRYVGAGNWAVNDTNGIIINPSYLAPYQYRVFAEIDPGHNWMELVDSSYKVLNSCTGTAGLAQDWCKIDNQGNLVKNFRLSKDDSSIYSYDAMRVPYRISMDYMLSNDPRAIEYLKRNEVFLRDWKNHEKIFAQYNQKGGYIAKYDSLANYGAQLARFSLLDVKIANEIFENKIKLIDSWSDKSFYDLSWVYFGLNFYLNYVKK